MKLKGYRKKKAKKEMLLKALMLSMKVDKWFLMFLKAEYFQYNQLNVQNVHQVC